MKTTDFTFFLKTLHPQALQCYGEPSGRRTDQILALVKKNDGKGGYLQEKKSQPFFKGESASESQTRARGRGSLRVLPGTRDAVCERRSQLGGFLCTRVQLWNRRPKPSTGTRQSPQGTDPSARGWAQDTRRHWAPEEGGRETADFCCLLMGLRLLMVSRSSDLSTRFPLPR